MKSHPKRVKQSVEKSRIPLCYDGERIHKVLAHAGLGSRRQIEQWIKDGRVNVNGKPAHVGDRLACDDVLQLDGRVVNIAKRIDVPTRVLIYYKPSGEVVARRDLQGRPVIFTQLPKLKVGRWIAVGRLDINTQGLLLVTTNGELANRLMHPSHEVDREYAVRVLGKVDDVVMGRLQRGVELVEDGPARFETLEEAGGQGANRWFHVTVKEGRHRLVRRLWQSQGVMVSRLIRIRYGPVTLPPKLKARTFHELDRTELTGLMAAVGMKVEEPKQPKPSGQPKTRSKPRRKR